MAKISLLHGEGGKQTQNLIKDIFYQNFDNEILLKDLDAATFNLSGRLAFTTDSYVVKPIFFNGGNIGSLAVHGTVNDLVVSGAKPLYLSCGFIIEEGFDIEDLIKIVKSMKYSCEWANVKIVTGDTKVVAKHEADGIFINTAGIGVVEGDYCVKLIEEEDVIIVTGTIADHGTSILNARFLLNHDEGIYSDSAPLSPYLDIIKPYLTDIKIMKDPTRGGIGSILNEISQYFFHDIEVEEELIPINDSVKAVNKLLGIDPLYVASEGRMLIIIKKDKANELVSDLRIINKHAAIIGTVKSKNKNPIVVLKTKIGGRRFISPLDQTILPRIC